MSPEFTIDLYVRGNPSSVSFVPVPCLYEKILDPVKVVDP